MGLGSRIRAELARRRGEARLAQGRFREAADELGRALAGAADPACRVKRGLALWEAGDRAAGLAEAEAGASALAASHPARLFWALLLLEEGKREEAGRIIDAVRGADPGNPFARGLQALDRILEGDPSEAGEALRGEVFASPLFRAHLLLAAERHLRGAMSPSKWNEAYLETVLA
jgi:tetratricopeptide (TPR) repeat protein